MEIGIDFFNKDIRVLGWRPVALYKPLKMVAVQPLKIGDDGGLILSIPYEFIPSQLWRIVIEVINDGNAEITPYVIIELQSRGVVELEGGGGICLKALYKKPYTKIYSSFVWEAIKVIESDIAFVRDGLCKQVRELKARLMALDIRVDVKEMVLDYGVVPLCGLAIVPLVYANIVNTDVVKAYMKSRHINCMVGVGHGGISGLCIVANARRCLENGSLKELNGCNARVIQYCLEGNSGEHISFWWSLFSGDRWYVWRGLKIVNRRALEVLVASEMKILSPDLLI